jgi:hypothetical protein
MNTVKRTIQVWAVAAGLLVNALLIGLFWRLRFYALGFDQDAWAPR